MEVFNFSVYNSRGSENGMESDDNNNNVFQKLFHKSSFTFTFAHFLIKIEGGGSSFLHNNALEKGPRSFNFDFYQPGQLYTCYLPSVHLAWKYDILPLTMVNYQYGH